MQYDEGLKYAILALSFFRSRHVRAPRFKNPNKAHSGRTVSCRVERVRTARKYVLLARKWGWRGSVITTIMELSATKKGGN
jgi:hypothetical protein